MAEGLSDPPDLNLDGPSHQNHNRQRSRGGRFRNHPDLDVNGSSHDPARHYRGFHQWFDPTSVRGNSAHAPYNRPPRQHEDGGRGRGRGGARASHRGGGRGLNGNAGGPRPRWQPSERRAGGPNVSGDGCRSGTPYGEESDPGGPLWRGAFAPRDAGPVPGYHSTRPKVPRAFSREPRRGQSENGQEGTRSAGEQKQRAHESSAPSSRSADAKEERRPSEDGRGNPRGGRGAYLNTRPAEPKRRRGPIKPPVPPPGPETGARAGAPARGRSSQDPAPGEPGGQGGREGPARQTPLQHTRQKRAQHQDLKPGQRKWDNVPESKETQTGCLIEQLSEEKYECMVCCDVIRLMAPVWSCQSCYHVFHLNCIKKWARSPASQADDSSDGWRCPACQNVADKQPASYTCFCGKVTNPEWQRSEIPHSCGDMCGKKRSGADCNHACNILCHPGPCPPCPALVTKACLCGRTSQPMRCGRAAVLRCDGVCGAALNCAEHRCTQTCHAGACQPCPLQVQQFCYCGVGSRQAPCGTDKEGFDGSGHFSCRKTCGKMLDCEAHQCQQECHPAPCQPCPRSPKLVRACCCGQTPLAKLLELGHRDRRTCSDPIPSCGKTCGRPLACGSSDAIHLCEELCHEGACGQCSLTSTVRCRCGSKAKEVPCALIHKEEELVFTCERRCNKKRACGRHKCNELCCVSALHRCPMICGHKLSCGLHRCQEPCHRGNCDPCWQSSFDELTCHCGETVLFPPIACGTLPPECKNLCTRRHECDHPVFHNCHSEDKCPPCTHLTQKWCMGNHEQRSNIPCHLQDISCGLPCGRPLPCDVHRCRRICHRGECLGEAACQQPCQQPRPECGHPCGAPCHQGSACPRNTCTAKVALHCHCGRREETVLCAEATSSYQKYAAISMASKLSDLQLGESVDIGQLITKKELRQTRLECDQECATLERNRRLAEALQIDASADPFNIRTPASSYSDGLKEDARKEWKFVSEVEKEIKNLVELANKGKQAKRSHCFPPMRREYRKIVHELAEAYAVESLSYDSEPKRNVVVTAHKGKSVCPSSTLTSLIERETTTRAPPPIAHIKQHSGKVDGGSTWSKMVKEEPAIDYFDVQD